MHIRFNGTCGVDTFFVGPVAPGQWPYIFSGYDASPADLGEKTWHPPILDAQPNALHLESASYVGQET